MRLHLGLLVAEELGRPELEANLAPGRRDLLGARGADDSGPARLAGAIALFGHRQLEATAVDLDASLARDLLGQLDVEAVGVVQLERDVTCDGGLAGGELGLEQCRAGPERT